MGCWFAGGVGCSKCERRVGVGVAVSVVGAFDFAAGLNWQTVGCKTSIWGWGRGRIEERPKREGCWVCVEGARSRVGSDTTDAGQRSVESSVLHRRGPNEK